MTGFEYKESEIISVILITFTEMQYIIDEGLQASDRALAATYKDGNVEILCLAKDNVQTYYSSESWEFLIEEDIESYIDEIISSYHCKRNENIKMTKNNFKRLGLDFDKYFKK